MSCDKDGRIQKEPDLIRQKNGLPESPIQDRVLENEMSEDEKFLSVAEDILREHRAAFEELAK